MRHRPATGRTARLRRRLGTGLRRARRGRPGRRASPPLPGSGSRSRGPTFRLRPPLTAYAPRIAPYVSDLAPCFTPGLRHGEGPGVHRVGVAVRFGGVLPLFSGARLQVLGVPALHSRPSGQEPDGGAEAFRRTGLIQLVLPTEPHGHQVGGPGPDNDCVDEAAAAHASHGRGVCVRPSANSAGVSHDLADISSFFCDRCDQQVAGAANLMR